jgi:hypothetical protein
MPPENPAVVQIDTELLDTTANRQVFSRRTLAYDQFNNVTDTTDYDYASVPATGTIAAAAPWAGVEGDAHEFRMVRE